MVEVGGTTGTAGSDAETKRPLEVSTRRNPRTRGREWDIRVLRSGWTPPGVSADDTFPNLRDPPEPSPAMSSRTISNLCWIASGIAIGLALLWIGLAEDKGIAILGGIAAVGLSRVLIVDVARWHDEKDASDPLDDDES